MVHFIASFLKTAFTFYLTVMFLQIFIKGKMELFFLKATFLIESTFQGKKDYQHFFKAVNKKKYMNICDFLYVFINREVLHITV